MKEIDIRPREIFEEYLRLAALDIDRFFVNAPSIDIPCPACGMEGTAAFKKNSFQYSQCEGCQTLFVSPRPTADCFRAYYTDSESTRYWATTFYRETEVVRREKIWKPKAALVTETVRRFAGSNQLVDIGGGYGTFAEEVAAIGGFNISVIEPSRHLADVCRRKGLNVVEKFLEDTQIDDLPVGPKSFVSFEIFEHLTDPGLFMSALHRLMQPEDLFVFTTLSGTGLDIQVLWESAKAVSPPHHLNFLNPQSVRILLERIGFDTIEVTTPGRLDVDILSNNRDLVKDRFWSAFLAHADDAAKATMQHAVAAHGFSSHMMVVARRRG